MGLFCYGYEFGFDVEQVLGVGGFGGCGIELGGAAAAKVAFALYYEDAFGVRYPGSEEMYGEGLRCVEVRQVGVVLVVEEGRVTVLSEGVVSGCAGYLAACEVKVGGDGVELVYVGDCVMRVAVPEAEVDAVVVLFLSVVKLFNHLLLLCFGVVG